MEPSKDRGTAFKLAIVCLAILLIASFWLTLRVNSEPVSMVVVPEAPRQGEPVLATFKLNNPSSEALATDYQFYTDGELLMQGVATIAPASSKTYQYAYANPLKMGEQVNFMVRTQSELGDYERAISSPPYPPQVWSSFVSFASFSTSVMSSMSTMTYFQSTFGTNMGLNVGIIASIVVITLLIFLELTQPLLLRRGTVTTLGRLRLRLSTVTWILFIIFMGIVYARVVMLLAT